MTLRGSTSDFPLESVIGLLAGTSKTGELQVHGGGKIGALGFAGGRLVAAVMDGEGGENALGAIFAIGEADFEFTPWASPPEANLEAGDLVALLRRAAEARDRINVIRASIPDDRMRFRLSEKAADSGAVTFTPDRWRALLAVNGERDVSAIAEQLRLPKMQTLTLLAGLVKDGVIEILTPPAPSFAPSEPPAPLAPEPPMAETYETPAPDATADSPPSASVEGGGWGSAESAPASPATEPEPEKPRDEASAPAPEWTPRSEPRAEEAEPPTEEREDLRAEIAERMGGFAPAQEPPRVPPAVDDRLASLSGLFAPGPAAAPAPPQEEKTAPAMDVWEKQPEPQRPAESWMTPPPAASETPANTWAPTAPSETPPNADPWGTSQSSSAAAPSTPRTDEWPAPQSAAPAQQAEKNEKKKSGGLFGGLFRREEPAPASITQISGPALPASRSGKLASLSNALLMEFQGSTYGKGKIETRLSNLLMRVDEQADPIDRPLPVVDDMIDAFALEREGFDEQQALPYLATLVRQIYEDAERAFGKDKAKKGYRAAQQQVFGSDPNALQTPELAGKLPKV